MKVKQGLLRKFTRFASIVYWQFIDDLSCHSEKIANLYEKHEISMDYRGEYYKAGITKDDKVLHIGCGPYPLTAIILAQQTSAKIVGIDKHLRNVKKAKKLIEKKNLQNQIKIDFGNGINYPVKNFNVIIFSSVANPKIKILDNILKNSKKDTKIILRELDPAIDSIKKYIDSHGILKLEKIKKNHPFPFVKPFGWESFYLIKK